MKTPEKNFLDKNTLIAVAVVSVFFIFWTRYLDTKYPKPVATPSATAPIKPVEGEKKAENPVAAAAPSKTEAKSAPVISQDEKVVEFGNGVMTGQVSSKGMGLKGVRLVQYQTRDGQPVILSSGTVPGSYATVAPDTGEALDFEITKKSDLEFIGRAQLNGTTVEKTLKFYPDRYDFDAEVKVIGVQVTTQGLGLLITDHQQNPVSSSFLVPTYDFQDWYIDHEGTSSRTILKKENEFKADYKNVAAAALSFHYFTTAYLDRSQIAPVFVAANAPNASFTSGRLIYQPVVPAAEFSTKFVGFVGPKLHSALSATDPKLGHVVDFGMFRVLAQPMLWLLKVFYATVDNWGIAIILLTLVIRVLVLPFNIYSFKSMKALQRIQPQMTAIKEKYKSDPAKMNQEVMLLMKESKANPLGGCLPILLQMPVFFALNAVLGQSIELYRVPFFGWITDLSSHDPYFVLPILMCIAMYLQTKLTPAPGGDPQQQKIMQIVPVVFSLLMIFIPSGLSLYILINTTFGIIQQYYLMRDKGTSASAITTAKA